MSKKMWNKIFKSKTTKNAKAIIPAAAENKSNNNRCSYYEEFQNSCIPTISNGGAKVQNSNSAIKPQIEQENPPSVDLTSTLAAVVAAAAAVTTPPTKQPSTFSKVVNTLTLKRNGSGCNTSCGKTKGKNALESNTIGRLDEEPTAVSVELVPCATCGRTFVQKTLVKHISICEKMNTKKRRIFDSSRQRREGTELASYPLPKNFGLPAAKPERGLSPKRMQTPPTQSPRKPAEELVKTTLRSSMRKPANQKNSSGASLSAIKDRSRTTATATPLAKRIQPPAAEQCPYCERCFGVKAYDRHVEWCKEKSLIASMKHNNTTTQAAAKERLEARTKYRAPCLKTKRSVNRDKYSGYGGDGDEQSIDDSKGTNMSTSMTSSFMSDGGLSDKYDPFLSAKRQLEELCSPTIPSDTLGYFSSTATTAPTTTTTTPSTPNSNAKPSSTPTTPHTILPLKMTTSLTSTTSLAPMTPSPNPKRALAAVKSNFRRTNSLRAATHKSPLLASRPIFIPSQNQRPTIQRGLSDEGPISSSFLKPEEYDEMPVRSVCVNDFAISNSPRIVRRDTSTSNRKNHLKLHLGGGGRHGNSSSKEASPTASKYLSKTDSLAVFLKYENEAARLASSNSGKELVESTCVGANENADSAVITKELKEKSNTLSKQNSAKNIIQEAQESLKRDEKSSDGGRLPTLVPQNSLDKTPPAYKLSNLNNVRLEPLTKPMTPSSPAPTTPVLKKAPSVAPPALALAVTSINLQSIFGESKKHSSLSKDRKNSSSSEYIDPKLINMCDNLPINMAGSRSNSNSKHSDPDSRTDSSAEFSAPEKNLPESISDGRGEKSLPDSRPEKLEALQASTAASTGNATNAVGCASSRHSNEGRNLLKRKMRVGRNQFLYDASPDADCCSADDEANRSSMECDEKQFNHQSQYNPSARMNTNTTTTTTTFEHSTPNTSHPQTQTYARHLQTPPSIPPLPIFDDFDFEEFLSSFENDDDHFPLFKDCREFLMNRTSSNKVRSTAMNSSKQQTHTKLQSQPISRPPPPPPSSIAPSNQSQFQNLNRNHILPSSFRSQAMMDTHLSARQCEEAISNNEEEDKKREIFISIETDQNDLVERGQDAESLQMVGNPNAHVEEVDANDNKFSKIEDDDEDDVENLVSSLNKCKTSASGHPNVKLNNAKNLIQQMHEDFRQISEEADEHLRRQATDDSEIGSPPMIYSSRSNRGGDPPGDSDEISSVECFPIPSSRRDGSGVASKLSADSAYGSLSRQRSGAPQRHINRPSTASSEATTMQALDAQQHLHHHHHHQQSIFKYSKGLSESQKYRSRQFSGASSSSGSDTSLLPVGHSQTNNNNNNHQLSQIMNHNSSSIELTSGHNTNNNFNNNDSPLSSPSPTAVQRRAPSPTTSDINTSMTLSMKMSKFCHECGSKFLIEQAKFCMDCGVRRIVL